MNLIFDESEINCQDCYNTGYILKENEQGYSETVPCKCYQQRILARRLKRSGINPAEYQRRTLENFDDKTEIAKTMKKAAIEFLSDNNAKGIGYFGKSGLGKTHICIAICLELALKKNQGHMYFSYREEMQKLTTSYYRNQQEYDDLMHKWKTCKNLYIDDFWKGSRNKQGDIDSTELRITYDIINGRYINNLRTIFSSEYTVSEIMKIDEAIGGRIYEMVMPYGVKCEGNNRRIGG